MAAGSYTTSTAFLEALAEAGVRYIFARRVRRDGVDPGVLKDALAVVQGGHSAVVSVQLPPV